MRLRMKEQSLKHDGPSRPCSSSSAFSAPSSFLLFIASIIIIIL